MVQKSAINVATGFVDTALIYSRWEEQSPSKEAQGVLDAFYERVTDRNWNENSEVLEIEDYRQMMAAAAHEFGLASPECDVFLGALMESKKRGARIYFVEQVCSKYAQLMAEQDKSQFSPKQHDDVLRAALAKATAEARHVNENGKAFIEDVLAVEPHLRGQAFPRDLAKWRGRNTEYGDPCRDLVTDVDRLYKNHMENQGKEFP